MKLAFCCEIDFVLQVHPLDAWEYIYIYFFLCRLVSSRLVRSSLVSSSPLQLCNIDLFVLQF